MVNKIIVALYIRVSTEMQVEGYSLDAQREALLEDCERVHAKVFKLYTDSGISASNVHNRPALQELLADAEKGCFNRVMCLRLNRLSRNLKDLLSIVDLLEKNQVGLYSLKERLETNTTMGKFVLQMMGATAQLERAQISQNVQLGMRERSKKGKWNSGNQVLGYLWFPHPVDPNLSRVEIVPEEAVLVQEIFASYVSGQGYKSIANQLNKRGVCTKRRKPFSATSIRGILNNWNYIGKVQFTSNSSQKQFVTGTHEPIITEELWKQVQLQLSHRSHPVRKTNLRFFPLSGLLKCPECGQGMIPGHVRRVRKNGAVSRSQYYVCGRSSAHGSSICRSNHVRAPEVEAWVNEQIIHFLSNPSIATRLITEINQRRDNTLEPHLKKIIQIDVQLSSLKNRNLRCFELFEDGHINNDTLKERLSEIKKESDLLVHERVTLERLISQTPEHSYPKASIQQALGDMRTILHTAQPEQQKALYRSLIRSIAISPDRDIQKTVIYGNNALLNLQIPPK
ncbi:recombinase family protein [Paenibacillus sp. FSL R7-0179]|uniref:recombinase family protein n=1 Tax=Paenibacillus sp. FSL R7-0179 TaxID=2921672 RepID=UPI0030F9470E